MFYEKNKRIFYFFPSAPPVPLERRPTRHHGVIMRGERAKDTIAFPFPRFRGRSRRARDTARRRRGNTREERAKSRPIVITTTGRPFIRRNLFRLRRPLTPGADAPRACLYTYI